MAIGVAAVQLAANDIDAATARRQLGRILDRREFSYERSPLSRFLGWVAERLVSLIDRILSALRVPGTGAAAGPGVASYVVASVLVCVAVAVVVFAVIRFSRRQRQAAAKDGEPAGPVASIRPNRSEDDWLAHAMDLDGAGSPKAAVLLRYRDLVSALVDNRTVGPAAGLTPGELNQQVSERAPAAGDAFEEATRLFEDPWYGDMPTGPTEVERLELLSRNVIGSTRGPDGSPSGHQMDGTSGPAAPRPEPATRETHHRGDR